VRYFMDQYSADEMIDHPVSAIEVQYATQTHEGDMLEVYRCDAEGVDAFEIDIDGAKAVSCTIER